MRGRFGVRIEDLVSVEDDGCHNSPAMKELQVVGDSTLRALLGDWIIPLGMLHLSRAMETATTPRDGASEHGSLNNLALSATFHCLIGCAIGEVVGMIIALSLGWSDIGQLALAVGLAYLFGFSLTAMPLVKPGWPLGSSSRRRSPPTRSRSRSWS